MGPTQHQICRQREVRLNQRLLCRQRRGHADVRRHGTHHRGRRILRRLRVHPKLHHHRSRVGRRSLSRCYLGSPDLEMPISAAPGRRLPDLVQIRQRSVEIYHQGVHLGHHHRGRQRRLRRRKLAQNLRGDLQRRRRQNPDWADQGGAEQRDHSCVALQVYRGFGQSGRQRLDSRWSVYRDVHRLASVGSD